MQYYKNIRWELDTTIYNTAKSILGKERYKRVLKLIPNLSDYIFEFKSIDIGNLPYDFFQQIYIPNINKKENSNPSNIIQKIKNGIENNNIYIFLEARYNNILIGGKILIIKKEGNLVSGRSSIDQHHQHINQYLEYLFIKFGLEHNMNTIGVGVSPNLCGYNMGSGPAVALHKLELHYSPLVTQHNQIGEINIDTINSESILFITEDDKKYTKALVIRPKNKPHDIRYNLLSKRGIEVSYHYFE